MLFTYFGILKCIILGLGTFLFLSCINDIDPEIPNEEELITTLQIDLYSEVGGEVHRFLFQDIDGEGGNIPFIESDTLKSGVLYRANVSLLNEQYVPAFSITEEVEEEGAEHQFFYQSTPIWGHFEYLDSDEFGFPIGLEFEVIFDSTGEQNFQVILRHEPDKAAEGVSEGDITNAGGETDIEVLFQLYVEE